MKKIQSMQAWLKTRDFELIDGAWVKKRPVEARLEPRVFLIESTDFIQQAVSS